MKEDNFYISREDLNLICGLTAKEVSSVFNAIACAYKGEETELSESERTMFNKLMSFNNSII